MSYQHRQMAAGRWRQMSFVEQMANLGSEVIRALNWRQKDNPDFSRRAFFRALELLSLTIDDPANRKRLRELTRLHEVLVDFFDGDNIYGSSRQNMQKYFLAFNHAAALARQADT